MKNYLEKIFGEISLKKKLITCFVLLAAVPLILTTIITANLSRSALVDSVYADNQHTAAFLAREADSTLGSLTEQLKDLAETADIQSMDTAQQLVLMKKVTAKSELIKTLIIDDVQGNHTVRTQGKLASNAEREYFKKLVGGAEYALSDIQVGNSSGVASLVIAVPIRDEQKNFKGALLGVIDLENLSKHIAETKVGQSGYAFLADRQGKIITHPDKNLMQQMADFSQFAPVKEAIDGKNGIVQYTDNDGEKLAGFSNVALSGWGVVVQQPVSEAMAKVNQLRTTGIVFTLLAIVCAIVVGIFAAGIITRPIRELVDVTHRLSEGDLTVRVHVVVKDEMGHLAETFNLMADHLRKLIRGVTETAEHVASSSQELSAIASQAELGISQVAATMTDFAAGAQKQTGEVENTLLVADHVSEASQNVAEQAMSAVNLSADMAKAAKTGGAAADSAVQKINEIKEATEQASQVISALGGKSQQIGQILEVISGIAGQTNLLALNAAIEAARAGEHGKGFAVVAEEVRKLAEQSQKATEEIAQIVGEIQQQTGEAIDAMDSGKNKVNEGVGVVQSAGHELSNIMEQVNRSVATINGINNASKQQVAKVKQMVGSTSNVASIAKESSAKAQTTAAATEEVTASMEEISRAAEALAKTAGELQAMVTRFTV